MQFISFMVNLPLNMGLNQGGGHRNSILKSHIITPYTLSLFAAFYLWGDSLGLGLVIAQLSKRKNQVPRVRCKEGISLDHF